MKSSVSKTAGLAGLLLLVGVAVRSAARRGRRFDLRGSACIVTGVSRGLGLAVARELARCGARVGPRNADFKGQADKQYARFAAGEAAPGVAMDADRPSRRVVDAARYGDGEATMPLNTKLLTLVHGISPNLFASATPITNRVLPSPGGIGTQSSKGFASDELEPRLTHAANNLAGQINNQF